MKLTVHTFVTLDGVMQGPGGRDEDRSNGFEHGGWLVPYVDDDFGRIVTEWFGHADEILLGRSTYDMMRSFWTEVDDPADPVATALNGLPKNVVSRTLTDASWHNSKVIAGDVVDSVTGLKARAGRELQVHGSWQLVRTLHDAGLVDEYRLLLFPVVLGSGKRLFADGAATTGFTLVDSEVTSTGVTHQVLRPTAFGTGEIVVEEGREVLVQPE
jgi:dihydrofolate reductase